MIRNNKLKRSIVICWEKYYYDDNLFSRKPYEKEGILIILPPIEDMFFNFGVWDEINNKINIIIDIFEEETIYLEKFIEVQDILLEYILKIESGQFNKNKFGYNDKDLFDFSKYIKEIIDFIHLSMSIQENIIIFL